ncbi:uncharacterized protein LOC111868519 isoform X5 [Cryptotermes secundus]|uniref:uncharacterized protein LOC111868519 isoform X5 n=1 Tax=Cryptotermes secundus TaxID=105785 RepID=UPI000CD7D266|nr:uncharacterized protein LOC111868519 isoform X5 [Cryptotermes secundus]
MSLSELSVKTVLLCNKMVDNQDDLPHTVCQSCSQKLGSFDSYAEQCQRVQAMFRAMVEATVEMGDEVDTKVGLIREEFLQESEDKGQAEEPVDSKKDIEMLAIEADPFIPSDCIAPGVKKSKVKALRKRVLRTRSNFKARGKKVRILTRAGNENKGRQEGERERERRVSSRLQSLAQTQRDFEAATAGVTDNELKIKEEKDEEDGGGGGEVEVPQQPTAKKRGRPPKALVGAAKRKAKIPRIVKLKPLETAIKEVPSEEDNDGNFDANNDTADNSENNEDENDDHDNDDDDDEDEYDDDDDDDDLKKKSEGSGEEKGTSSETSHQPAIFRWECHVCGEVCRNWNSLSVHCRRMHEEAAHVVCLCAKVLASRASIIKHRLKHTNTYKYRCTKCDKAFHRRALYDIHVLSHVPKEEQPFVCCKCARRFHCEALLRQHERVHLPREERLIYPCDICSKKFSSKSAVSAHLKAVHFGERPFVCDQCGHSFTSKGILQEHLTIHSDETPFKCTQCKKSFKTKYRLKIHSDTHRETPYQCPVCPLQLSTRRTLRMHLVVHRDTKAYQCATCGKAFRRAKDLKNHHNLHTGRRPYTCTFCPRTFANGSNCRSHKRRMHPEELRLYEASLAAAENNDSQAPSESAPSVAVTGSNSNAEQQPADQPNISMNSSLPNSLTPVPKSEISVPISEFQRRSSSDSHMYGSPTLKNLHSPNVSRPSTNLAASMSSSSSIDFSGSVSSDPGVARVVMGHLTTGSGASMLRNASMLPSLVPISTAASMIRDAEANNCNNIRLSQHSRSSAHGLQVSAGDDGSCDRSQTAMSMNGSRRINSSTADSILNATHLQSLAPLNLNISEIHSNRQQQHSMNSSSNLSGMDDSDLMSRGRRVMDGFPSSASQRPHISALNSNVHQVHRQQHHHSLATLSRSGDSERDMLDLDRASQRDLSSLSQMHHHNQQQQHSAMLHEFPPSLNHLYQHQGTSMSSAVAAAIAHSGTVGVPAFPGNPYVHHNMGYNRGNGSM